ncbi:hypothetical protein Lfu02_01400 [Longispora fulva]|uniref:Nitrite reductase/ring-hydroxylating ferredoxin subunit n=1 Tax=Longispora fulva TaxID=619741 RepID=A0A8J7KFC0_9ACTN|nr:Rieske 2Fe-2S domain-containing protein [Longispora fulva]MBG6135990.1 nitrite reductase/ring-hydroxylating ferredoxin subunit [Longispora fulva]GIG55768.1 hypothetical protein Lfu02_01400 [Longispora fulva]
MLVLTFAADGAGNCVEVGGQLYVFARTRLGSFMLPARCPHRGGPLNLGHIDPDRDRLICPWHEGPISMRRLIRQGIPSVRRENTVTAVFAVAADTEHRTSHLPLSADLTVGGSGSHHD